MFEVKEYTMYTFIEADGRDVEPEDIKRLQLPRFNNSKGVILRVKGPAWFTAYLAHAFSTAIWVAVYEPIQERAIVVASRFPLRPGACIEVELESG